MYMMLSQFPVPDASQDEFDRLVQDGAGNPGEKHIREGECGGHLGDRAVGERTCIGRKRWNLHGILHNY